MDDTQNNSTKAFSIPVEESPFKLILEHQDRYLWALCCAPVFCTLIEISLPINIYLIPLLYICTNISLSILDERELKRSNRPSPAHWSILVVPIYIWQRLKLNQQDKRLFAGWCAAFMISISAGIVNQESILEDTACEIVTDIIFNKYGAGQYGDKAAAIISANPELDTPNCIAVSIYESVTDSFHKSIATLENGNDVEIIIKENNNQVEVVINNLNRRDIQ